MSAAGEGTPIGAPCVSAEADRAALAAAEGRAGAGGAADPGGAGGGGGGFEDAARPRRRARGPRRSFIAREPSTARASARGREVGADAGLHGVEERIARGGGAVGQGTEPEPRGVGAEAVVEDLGEQQARQGRG